MSVKMGGDILVARAVFSTSGAVLILPAAFIVAPPDAEAWRVLALGLPAHFFHQMCLIRAMQGGDLPRVFPVMRSAAPLLTALSALILLNETLEPSAWLGVVMATLAVASFALPPRGIRLRPSGQDRAGLGCGDRGRKIALQRRRRARSVDRARPLTYIVWLLLHDGLRWPC